jgi:hypothetical protein
MIDGTMEQLTWFVGSVVVGVAVGLGLVAVAKWPRWLCRRCRLGPNRAGDPVAKRLQTVNGQIGATQQRFYRKRKESCLPVVHFTRHPPIGSEALLETDGSKVVAPTPDTVDAKHTSSFHFQVRDRKLFFWTLDPARAAPLVFQDGVNTVTELQDWFELEKHVVLFVATQAAGDIVEYGAWNVPTADLLLRLATYAGRSD